MKKILFTLAGLALLTGIASADSLSHYEIMFKSMDQDEAGKVSANEFFETWKKNFKQQDENGNGVLDHSEVRDEKIFQSFDANNDDAVDADEDHAKRREHFAILDTDHDGSLTLAELRRRAAPSTTEARE